MTEQTRETKLSAAFVKLADTLVADYDVVELLHWLVDECTRMLDTQAGGLMLVDPAGELQLVASTSEDAELVEILQLAAGEGPCLECFDTGRPVTVGDIRESADRWPEFAAGALAHDFRSVHATPLRLRGEVIGTMNLFSVHVGELASADVAVAQALADVATIGILQERAIRSSNVVAEQLQFALDSRILVEQAKGVLAATSNLSMNDAFATLRSYARNHNRTLRSVAEDVIARKLDPAQAEAETPRSDGR